MASINKNIIDRLNEYFIARLGMHTYTRGWLKGDCPSCGREGKFGVQLGQNRSNCFYCGYHERPIFVVMRFEDLPTLSATYKYLGAFTGVEYRDIKVEKFKKKEVNLPPSFCLLTEGDDTYAKVARNYISKRGLNPKRLSHKGWGYCTTGKYSGYIIMPIWYMDKLIYFNARLFLGNGPKFNNPPVEEFGLGKNEIMYNRDALYIYKRVFLAESITNCETLGDEAVGIGGKKISDVQYNYIIKSPVEAVVIILDPDAITDSIKLALRLCIYKKVKVVLLPEGEDINSYGKINTLREVYKQKYESYNFFIRWLMELQKRKGIPQST